VRASIAIVVAAGLLVGFTDSVAAEGDENAEITEERFARYYLPWGADTPLGEWQPESTVPRDHQEAFKMVIWEVSRFHDVDELTPQQKEERDKLIEACYASAKANEWYNFPNSYEAGYRKMYDDKTHFGNEAFVLDDAILDPERPEFLMYYPAPTGRQLIGYMFLVNKPLAEGPQIAGPQSIWHYHVWNEPFCLLKNLLIIGRPERNGACERGEVTHRSPEMIHVWLVDHPDGPFASKMEIDALLLPVLLEDRLQERGY
jgi:hypothetical protein